MKTTLSLICMNCASVVAFVLFHSASSIAQQIGIYEFTAAGACPVVATSVTAQPSNAVFSSYSTLGTTCTPAANVFNNSAWNTTAVIDLAEYNQFTITPNACTIMQLDSLKYLERVSGSAGTNTTVTIRSSLDGYTTNIYSGVITVVSTDINRIVILPAAFDNLTTAVTFRIYVTSIGAAGSTYRNDNVALYGTLSTGLLSDYYADSDGDGFGNSDVFVLNTCTPPMGYILDSTDCNDANATIYPGATELCDGLDNDCDGSTDESVVNQTYYIDVDSDGFGNPLIDSVACSSVAGYVLNNSDCDDNNPSIGVATTTFYQDFDGDSFGNPAVDSLACTAPTGYVSNNTDCNDNNNAILGQQTYFADTDTDGFGSPSVTQSACSQPMGFVTNNTDCNDSNPNQFPGATEISDNGIDEDCNGSDLSTLGSELGLYQFTGNACDSLVLNVTTQPTGITFSDYSSDSTNCSAGANVFNRTQWNTNATIDVTEFNEFTITPQDCFGFTLARLTFLHRTSTSGGTPTVIIRSSLDNFSSDVYTTQIVTANVNQNDTVLFSSAFANLTTALTFRLYVVGIGSSTATYRNDNVSVVGTINTLTPQTYYADSDNDGFGDNLSDTMTCSAPIGYVSDNTDCNDTNAAINPTTEWFQDSDSDGFGNVAISLVQCVQPIGYVLDSLDCDDNDAGSGGASTYYSDLDFDGFGDPNTAFTTCNIVVGFVGNDLDCDDNNSNINPDATEVCDGEDNDCDGLTDEGLAVQTWFEDGDSDTFGNPNSMIQDCVQPTGYVLDDTDCDDSNASINPNGTEIMDNGIDEDCDGEDLTSGIEELASIQVTLTPNPGTESFTVQSDELTEMTIVVFSADGKPVFATSTQNGAATITSSSWSTGVYLVTIGNGKSSVVKRWMKQ